jgi:hypothetical protein
MGSVVTKEKDIIRAQYLDLLYSKCGTLYDPIPHAPRPLNDPTRPAPKPDSISNTKTILAPSQTSEVNAIQSTSSQQTRGKNKNKGKYKKPSNQ